MKIAIPTRDGSIDDHFGHCEYYTIYTADEKNQVVKKEILKSPPGCGCKSSIVGDLSEIGVSVMLAGNMGQGAYNLLESYGIQVLRGCTGSVDNLVIDYLKGALADSKITCREHGNECSH